MNGDFKETADDWATNCTIKLENGIQISTSTKEGEENIFSISLLGKRGAPQFYNYAEKLLLCLEGAEKAEVEEFVTEMKAESASNKRHDKLKNWEKLQTTIGKFKVMFSVVQSLDQDTMYIKFDDGRW